MTDQPTPEELRAILEESSMEVSNSPEPTPLEPEPEPMSLETFQSLPADEQATIWNLISLTKDDTTKILELVRPSEPGQEDPMQELLGQILELMTAMGETQHKHTKKLEKIEKRLPPAPPAETQH